MTRIEFTRQTTRLPAAPAKLPRIAGGAGDCMEAQMRDFVTSRVVRANTAHLSYWAWGSFLREYKIHTDTVHINAGDYDRLREIIREEFPGCEETGVGIYGLRIVPRIAGGADTARHYMAALDAKLPFCGEPMRPGDTKTWDAGAPTCTACKRAIRDSSRSGGKGVYLRPVRIAGGADIPDSVLDFVRTQITAEPDAWLPEADALAAYRAHVGRKRIKANERDGIAPALLSGYGAKYLAIFPDGEEQLGFRGVGLRTAPEPPQREPDAPTQAPTVGRSHAHPPIPGRESLDHTNLDHDHLPDPAPEPRKFAKCKACNSKMADVAPDGVCVDTRACQKRQQAAQKRRASRAESETARVHAAFPSCKQCGSGSQTLREDGACRDQRSCDARRMARSQMAADAARERVKAKRAKRMQDALSESTPVEEGDGPGSFPAVSADQRDSMARWLIAMTEPKSGEWTAWESIYRAYGWNEWNGAGDGKKMYPNINERNALSDALRGIYPDAAWAKHSGIGGVKGVKLLDAPVWPDPVPADKRDHISPGKPEAVAADRKQRAATVAKMEADMGSIANPESNTGSLLPYAKPSPMILWTCSECGEEVVCDPGANHLEPGDIKWVEKQLQDRHMEHSPKHSQPDTESETPNLAKRNIPVVRWNCILCGERFERSASGRYFNHEEGVAAIQKLAADHLCPRSPLMEAEPLATLTAPESPAPITTPFTTESDIPLPSFDPPARTLPDNVRDAVDQHPDAARFVVNGLEKSPDGGAVPCKALRACMDKYLGRSCTLQEVAAMEAIAGFQYGMTYENRFGSDVFANVQIVPVVAEPSVTHYQHQSGDALCGTDTRDVDGWAEDESATCKECLSMLGSFPDSDVPSPANDPDLIDLYIAAVEQRNYLATAHETAKETVREMEEPLRQEFIERGTQSVNRHGWSVHMRRDLWARVLGEDRDKAYAALRALPEWQHLVTETVNAQSLKSTVRSLQESRGLAKGASDEELAAGILPASLRAHIGLGRQTTIRATRSRKES